MNRFRKLGFIQYNGRITVHKSLLNVVLHDLPFEQNAVSAPLLIKATINQPGMAGSVFKIEQN
jgi:hypothetical protein